jgi:hypothetical protein
MGRVVAFVWYRGIEGVQGYLGRLERKKAFGEYSGGEEVHGYFGSWYN